MRIAVWLYGLAGIATGLTDLIWREFDPAEEPIQAFGDNVPGREIMALVIALLLIFGGAAVLTARWRRIGAVVLGGCYVLFAIFNSPRLVTAPHYLGVHTGVFAGVLAGVFQQLILVAAAAIVAAGTVPGDERTVMRVTIAARWIFALGSIDFGLGHLYNLANTAKLVPAYMPLGQQFWVGLTGACFILAGLAILIRRYDVVAARLLALMLLVFSVLALFPQIVHFPHAHAAWGVNAYNLAAVASAWIYAEWIGALRRSTGSASVDEAHGGA